MRPLERFKGLRFVEILGRKFDLLEEVGIDRVNFDRTLMNHAETAVFWSRLRGVEHTKLRRVEDELRELEASKFIDYWDYLESKKRTFSDSLVRSYMNTDPQIQKKRKEVRKLKKSWEVLNDVVGAMEHRRSCLMHLGALQRKERESAEGLTIRRSKHVEGQ